MITIKNIQYQTTTMGKKLNQTQEIQFARKIEKFLLKESITCDIEVSK
jgi:hypothetical protein